MTKILIADDHQQNLYLLRFLLESKGHEVTAASNGREALDLARLDPPEMIITDILMPVMDGFTLCRQWQSDERLQDIPFVFYTATYTDEKDKKLGLSLGATRFIIKPIEPDTLYTIFEEVIAEHRGGRLIVPEVDLEEEPVFLKQYNERLVKKLEDKMLQLEQANQRLEAEVAARTAELTIALEQAQAANRLKSRFISDINHELRTPLNNLTLYLSFLERGQPEKRPGYISVLRRETERLQWLISQLLDFSHLDAGKLAANLEPVDLNELVNTLVSDRRHLVQDKGLTLDFVPASQLPSVLADSKLLFQVLTNLLSNAINYTLPGGAVAIQTAISEEDGRQWVTVTVRDTGLGMSSDDQTHLFERFFRGEAADITHASGAGLGLAICREIIDRHGGRITVRSEIGRGSSFTLWLQPAVPI
jgi:hypothetical protein